MKKQNKAKVNGNRQYQYKEHVNLQSKTRHGIRQYSQTSRKSTNVIRADVIPGTHNEGRLDVKDALSVRDDIRWITSINTEKEVLNKLHRWKDSFTGR